MADPTDSASTNDNTPEPAKKKRQKEKSEVGERISDHYVTKDIMDPSGSSSESSDVIC